MLRAKLDSVPLLKGWAGFRAGTELRVSWSKQSPLRAPFRLEFLNVSNGTI